MATDKQIDMIRGLANRILAVDVSSLPTKAKAPAPARFTFNPHANAVAAQKIASELLGRLDVEDLSIGTASAWISDLQVQVRRARA